MTQDEAYERDAAKYQKDWSSDDFPLLLEEVGAYKAGHGDGWAAARSTLLPALEEARDALKMTLDYLGEGRVIVHRSGATGVYIESKPIAKALSNLNEIIGGKL